MASKAVREALNICGWVHNGNPLGPTADDPALLHTLVAHATEAERAALLRTLLGERLARMARPNIPDIDGNPGEPVVLVTSRRGWSGINVEPDHLLNLLAPSPAPLEGTDDG
jgi:hypothetical protein